MVLHDMDHAMTTEHKNKFKINVTCLKLYFWASLWLMVILVLGTIKQKEIGLYHSQQIYFDSWFFWLGQFPLPGGKFTITLIFWGLCYQLFYKTDFKNKKKIGITLAHIGVLFLFIGSIITNLTNIEGSMIIPEGKTINYFQDYHLIEMAVSPVEGSAFLKTAAFNQNDLKKNQHLTVSNTSLKINILNFYKNSIIQPINAHDNLAQKKRYGLSSRFKAIEAPLNSNENENVPSIEFEVTGSEDSGIYLIYKDMPVNQTMRAIDGSRWQFEIRSLRHYIPFSITLNDFEKTYYPSSQIPKSFKSSIVLHDNSIDQKIEIKMNEPLRYKGFTFYQSSFSENSNGEITDLAVVKNEGKYFPYISSIIICIGIFIHLLLNMSSLFKQIPIRVQDE